MRLTEPVILKLISTYCQGRSFSDNTTKRYLLDARVFFQWLRDQKGISDLRNIEGKTIMEYQSYLLNTKNTEGKARYSASTRRGMMSSLSKLFRILERRELILGSPFDRIKLESGSRKVMRKILSEEEVTVFLDEIKGPDHLSLRDKALFELLYGTGIRSGEALKLDVTDIDLKNKKLFIRCGKGKKDRIVPFGKTTGQSLNAYLRSRKKLVKKLGYEEDEKAVFLTIKGRRIKHWSIGVRLRKWLDEAGINRNGICPHTLRHTFATHMLDNGANIKHVKEILGHQSLDTTSIYTHVGVKSLKRLVRMYHPRENELYMDRWPALEEFLANFEAQ